jgi:hypothetical protein
MLIASLVAVRSAAGRGVDSGVFSPCGLISSWGSLAELPLTMGSKTTAPSVPGREVAVGSTATAAEFSRDATQNNTAIMEMNANTAITPIKYNPASGPRPNRSACGFGVGSSDGGLLLNRPMTLRPHLTMGLPFRGTQPIGFNCMLARR